MTMRREGKALSDPRCRIPLLGTGENEDSVILETDPDIASGFRSSLSQDARAQRLAILEPQGDKRGMTDKAPFDHACSGSCLAVVTNEMQAFGTNQDVNPLTGKESVCRDIAHR